MNVAKGNTLRQRAEKRLGANKTKDPSHLSTEDAQKLIHELHVHQVELEIQNEQLQRTLTELEASTAQYVDFYEFTPVGYLTLDEGGRIQASNLTAATLLGIERSLLMEKPLELIIQPGSLPVFHLFLKTIFSAGRKQTAELKLINKGAEERFIYLEGMAMDNTTTGAARQCRVVMIDITKRKEMEKQIESFSYSVAHDLREPLRAIEGFSRILRRDLQDKLDDEARRKFDVIREKTAKMDQLITDLLEYSRLGRAKVTFIAGDLTNLAKEAWEELRSDHAERVITMKISPLPDCYCDEKLIRQVFANLIGNAVKFTEGKSSVTIEVEGHENANECVYQVKDNGIGFDMRYYDRLFQIFRRLHGDGEYEGTGVGLSIVKRIVELHGGRVWAEGMVGEGATFYFSLPKETQGFTNP